MQSARHERDHLVPAPSVSPAPFKHGERVHLAGPHGERYVVRVESITPRTLDRFALVAAVVEPRNLRNQLISTVVDSFGSTLRATA
jgi:hypothetical protein